MEAVSKAGIERWGIACGRSKVQHPILVSKVFCVSLAFGVLHWGHPGGISPPFFFSGELGPPEWGAGIS